MSEIIIAIQIAAAVISVNMFLYLLGKERNLAGNSLLVLMGSIFLYNILGFSNNFTTSYHRAYLYDILYEILEMVLWVCILILIRDILGLRTNKKYVLYPAIVFGIIFVIRLADPWLGLYYRKVWYALEGRRVVMHVELGPVGWVYVGLYTLLEIVLFLNALTENIKHRKGASKVRRRRLLLTLIITMLPLLNIYFWAAEVFYKREAAMVIMLLQGVFLLHTMVSFGFKNVVRNANNLIMDNMDLGIVIVDRNYCYLDSNRFAKKLYPILEKLSEEDSLKENAPEVYEIFAGEKTRRFQIEEGYYECQVFHVKPEDKVQGFVAGIYDVTEQTRYQNELVFRRQKAEEISRQKSALLANASHEIRTPMNVILGMSELCLRKNEDPEITYGLRSIYSSAKGLLEVVESILDLSRIELEHPRVEEALYSLERVLMETAGLICNKLQGKPVRFDMEFMTGVPKWVYGDIGKVRSILVNLLGNAEKYTQSGSIRFQISAKEEAEMIELSFIVSDTGIGMKEGEAEKIFETFVRAEGAEEKTIPGSGLGLAITRQLVEMMKGTIRVESHPGEGSSFFVTIRQRKADSPCMKAGEIDDKVVTEYLLQERIITEVGCSYEGINALVVDDLMANILVEKGILELYGIKVAAANSGKQAIKMAECCSYDIFFIDLRLPEMNGEEILHRLRCMETYVHTPMIALTASNDMETLRHSEQAGFDEVMTKPIERPVLEQILQKYFNGASRVVIPKETGEKRDRRRILNSYYLQVSKLQGQLLQQSEEDLEHFVINVHGIKGASRSIGAVEMAREAERLEMAGREARTDDIRRMLPSFLDMLKDTLSQTKEELALLESNQKEAIGEPREACLERKVLTKLMGALKRFELDEAEELLDSLAQYHYEQEEQNLLDELRNDVAELDYEIAIGKIKDFLGKTS